MTIEYSTSPRLSWTYKFTPPMQAGQARVRLESMHQEAKEGLGISKVTVNGISLSGGAWISILLCLALNVWLLVTPSSSIARTLRWQAPMFRPIFSLFSISPTSQNFGNAIKTFWCGSLGIAHFVEIFACLNPLLRRYNVKNPVTRFVWVRFASPLFLCLCPSQALQILTSFGSYRWSAVKSVDSQSGNL